jgi:glyoxylase-like metal-dependent hydrolase (beta-lactamase superfamily II)
MAAAAEPQPASLPLPGGREGATVRVRPLLTATCQAPKAWLLREEGRLAKPHALGMLGAEKVESPIQAFLVEHPSAGPILIDTGLHPSCAVDPKQNLGRVGAAAFGNGLKMETSQAVPARLRAAGIDPKSVKLVVMTHLHVDHASAISEFPAATFVVAKQEWEAAIEPRGELRGYRRQQFDHAFDYRLLDFDGADTESFASFGRSFDLLGDGSIRVVFTPGHTRGHMSVVLQLSEGELLMAGDAAFTRETLRTGHLPYMLDDTHRFKRSLKEIQMYMELTPDAPVIVGHDIEAWRELPEVFE